METVIARLLQDFETGKMTRRQLVQSLALVAVGVPVASAVAQTIPAAAISTSSAAPWKTVYLDHISFQVSDYKRSTDFYAGLMGWKVLKEDAGRQATLDINGIGGIIIRNGRRNAANGASAGAPPAAAPDTAGRPARAPITGVVDHISWGIEPWDNDAVKHELESRGLTPRPDSGGDPDMKTSKFKSYHVKDPDGWDLQISNQTKAKHEL
ncbi:MAG: Glyoxalase/bleomycin resistance protein/dioxygenase [Gemmatimonadetes bacterium]|nr:Glyoxalase/bleomycin resistance protein/dioxygenase [Gemmatimonadota bacterium]